jgi:adenine-specific DNA-methyltransferase
MSTSRKISSRSTYNGKGKTKTEFQSFYTKNPAIAGYMVDQLTLQPGVRILEPCAGDGVFVEEILSRTGSVDIDAFEMDVTAVATLESKFSSMPQVSIEETDVLLNDDLGLFSQMGGIYDRIIANPPYGAWQDYEKRKVLKHRFPGLYVRETYSLFLHKCIDLLREDGILVFIIPDTYLSLHLHKQLRHKILTETRVLEIALFPSSFFPGVNFGYSNLSILTLQKVSSQKECLANEFTVMDGFNTVGDIRARNGKRRKFRQKQVLGALDHAFMVHNGSSKASTLINKAEIRLGDIAACVTGFYSGNDKQFLRAIHSDAHKNSRNYPEIDPDSICPVASANGTLLEGLQDQRHFVPIVKGGSVGFYKPEIWFMDWSREAVAHYKTDKKARFQNPSYYFRRGVGVPMVSSRQITAALIENQLFDQSIVGVFPEQEKYVPYLLALFNSPTGNRLVRTINPTANNSANYLKKVPFIVPDENSLAQIDALVKQIVTERKKGNSKTEELQLSVNAAIEKIYGL